MVKLDDFDFKGQLPIWKIYVNGIPTTTAPLGALSSTLLSILKCNSDFELKVELYRDEIIKSGIVSHEVHKDKSISF